MRVNPHNTCIREFARVLMSIWQRNVRHTTYLREPDIVPMAYWRVNVVRAVLIRPYQRVITAKRKR